MSLYQSLFYEEEYLSLFEPKQLVKNMLRVETALTNAQAQQGVIPKGVATIISECCQVNLINVDKLMSDIPLGGNAAIPLVKQLIRTVKNNDFEASKYVHLGATSQDIVDTATILAIKDAYVAADDIFQRLFQSLEQLIEKHRNSVMIGRTLMQQAKPITFGLKVAYWMQSLKYVHERMQESKKRVLWAQLGGAVGSGSQYLSEHVRKQFAADLGLAFGAPWQTYRGPMAEWASDMGMLSGVLEKIAKDIVLMMQVEIAEVFEGEEKGKGGSSTMPHKRNPVSCSAILANTHRVPHLVASILSGMGHEHERSTGLWHAEWEVISDLTSLTLSALHKTTTLVQGLEIDTQRMRKNLELTQGLIYAENVSQALTAKLGKGNAHEWVKKACQQAIKEGKHLKTVLETSGEFIDHIDDLFNPDLSIGDSNLIINEILGKDEH